MFTRLNDGTLTKFCYLCSTKPAITNHYVLNLAQYPALAYELVDNLQEDNRITISVCVECRENITAIVAEMNDQAEVKAFGFGNNY